MKVKKKLLAVGVTAFLATVALAGCSGGSDNHTGNAAEGLTYNGVDVSEPVTLTMYLLGEHAADFDMVYNRVNEILADRVNATLNVKFLSWDEMSPKYPMLFSAGEEFDLIFTASGWAYYESIAAQNGFYAMSEDFIKTYAPDIAELMPEEAWQQAVFNGAVYMIPNYQHEYSMDVVGVRGDLMKKYHYEDISTPEELEAFLNDVADNETDITPLGTKSGGCLAGYYLYPGKYPVSGTPSYLFVYNLDDVGDLRIEYTVETDRFMEYAKKMKEFYDRDYWYSDTLSATDVRSDSWEQGKAAVMVWNLGSVVNCASEMNKEHPDWKATFVDPAAGFAKRCSAYINNGIGINSASRNPERAMMVINELMTNRELYDLTSLGIEGVHWERVGDSEYRSLDAAGRFPPNGSCNWGWVNMEIARTKHLDGTDAVYEKQQAVLDAWNAANAAPHPYTAFSFDGENVRTELDRVYEIITQYYEPISAGLVDNPETAVEELRAKLEEAGIRVVYEEIQRQADEFLTAKQY